MASKPRSKSVRFENLESRRLLAAINVADFGARPNDGIDDAAAIRAAIRASKPGDTINFGAGTYNVNSTVEVASNRVYQGNSTTLARQPGTDFILSTDATTTNFTINGFTFDGAGITFYGPQASNVKITNNTFQNLKGGWTVGNAMVLPKGMKDSLIQGNTFRNIWGETGIFGFGAWDNSTISNNRFEDVMEGIHMLYHGDGLKIVNNTFVRVKRMGIELQGTGAKNTLVADNHLSEWRDRYHESFALSIVNFGDNTIIRNNFMSSGKPGQADPQAKQAPIAIEAAGRNMVIEGNIIEGFNEGIHLMYNPDTVVRNNTLVNQTWMAVWRTGVHDAPRVTVENNIIINPGTYAFLWQGSSAGQAGTNIRNNRIELKGKAYEFEGNRSGVTLSNSINKGVSSLPTLPNAGAQGTPSAPPSTPVTPTPPVTPDPEVEEAVPGVGNGLTAEYYNTANFSGAPITRLDSTVNFNWGYGSPMNQLKSDFYSVRWTGQVEAPVSGEYTFFVTADDGVRLWVDGKLVVDGWKDQALTTYQGKITLQAGRKYDVKMEYYERTGESQAILSWATPIAARHVIPKSQLHSDQSGATPEPLPPVTTPPVTTPPVTTPPVTTPPVTTPPADGGTNGLLGEYYRQLNFGGGTPITRTDANVNFSWGYGSPIAGLGTDFYSIRWTGQVLAPSTGEYSFVVTGDDGVRLWVDGKLIVDGWKDQALTTYVGKISLEANKRYDIKLEYYDRTNESQVKLLWTTPGTSTRVVVPQGNLFTGATASGVLGVSSNTYSVTEAAAASSATSAQAPTPVSTTAARSIIARFSNVAISGL